MTTKTARGVGRDGLVSVICRHKGEPRELGRVLPGTILWLPSCTDSRGRMNPHVADPTRIG